MKLIVECVRLLYALGDVDNDLVVETPTKKVRSTMVTSWLGWEKNRSCVRETSEESGGRVRACVRVCTRGLGEGRAAGGRRPEAEGAGEWGMGCFWDCRGEGMGGESGADEFGDDQGTEVR